jgi:hypothetical protein
MQYKMHNIVEKHFSISIAPVRSQGESLVNITRISMKIKLSVLLSEPPNLN